MDPENSNDNPNANGTPTAAIAQQPAVSFSSLEEFEARLQQERNAAAAAARREAEARLTKPRTEPPKAKPPEPAVNAAPADDRAFEDHLADALADHAGLSRDQRTLVRRLARQDRPENIDEYIANMARTFGPAQSAPAAQPQATTTQPAPTAAHPAAPVPPVHAPLTAVSNDGPDDVVRWNESQWEAYVRRKGADPSNPYHWKNREVHRDLTRRYEASMATRRIVRK